MAQLGMSAAPHRGVLPCGADVPSTSRWAPGCAAQGAPASPPREGASSTDSGAPVTRAASQPVPIPSCPGAAQGCFGAPEDAPTGGCTARAGDGLGSPTGVALSSGELRPHGAGSSWSGSSTGSSASTRERALASAFDSVVAGQGSPTSAVCGAASVGGGEAEGEVDTAPEAGSPAPPAITAPVAARVVCITLFDAPPHDINSEDGEDGEWSDEEDDGDGLGFARRFVAAAVSDSVDLAEVNAADKPWKELWRQVGTRLLPRWLRSIRLQDSPAFMAVTAAFDRLLWARTALAGVLAEACHEFSTGDCAVHRLSTGHGGAGDGFDDGLGVDAVARGGIGELRPDAPGPGDGLTLAEMLQSFTLAECLLRGRGQAWGESSPPRDAKEAAAAAARRSCAAALGKALCALCRAPSLLHSEAAVERLCATACRLVAAPAHVGVAPVASLLSRLASHWRSAGAGCIDAQSQVSWLRIVQGVLLNCPHAAWPPIPSGLPAPRGKNLRKERAREPLLGDAQLSRLFRWVADCARSPHPAVARAALELMGNAAVQSTYVFPQRRVADVLAHALVDNRSHWDASVGAASEALFDAMLDMR